MRVGEGTKTFAAMKVMFNVRNVSLGVMRQLYVMMTHGAETWIIKMIKIYVVQNLELKI